MTQQSLAEILRANPWFEKLSEEHLEMFLSIATLVRWPEKRIIFREGSIDLNLYLILNGRVALDVSVPTKGKVTILSLGENEVFGWSAVVPVVSIKTASARTIQETEAIAINAEVLREYCEKDHELGYLVYRRLTNVIAGRLSATRLQLLDMYAHGPLGD